MKSSYYVTAVIMESPIVEVEQGQLSGTRENNINGVDFYAFKGIPFAKPPVDDLRFKDPEPADSWKGIRDASKFGDRCAQNDLFTKEMTGSDDCLYLNIYTTELKPEVPRAVMVWIHGGAFYSGSGNDDIYGPDYIVEKNVVLVTINYRVGIIGFLNLDDEEAPGNQGLKDQVMALKWVKQNIEKFGGDPFNVTIFGESAGSASVHYLTISPLAQGLFNKAILQSGVATNTWANAPFSAKEAAIEVSAVVGNRITDTKELIKFLRSVDALQLVQAEYAIKDLKKLHLFENPFIPSVDLKSKTPFLNIPVTEAAKAGIRVPHIIGYTSDEGIVFVPTIAESSYAEIEANPEELLLHRTIKRFLKERNISAKDIKEYFMADKEIKPENADKIVHLFTAVHFLINIHHILELQPFKDVETFVYKFEFYSKDSAVMQKVFGTELEGTCHAEDIVYLFRPKLFNAMGIEPPENCSTEGVIRQRFVELWTNFAKTGNPNSTSQIVDVEWLPIENATEFNCLKISKDLDLIRETNILHKLSAKFQK
ncbi:juvenile hormone esterase-like [Cotesia glomerata]|uniref:juvenile hormone esterase-like n=1 Tax=Cotesia glomerata TaxID=32391 RepID=UPI001D031627|nr:juvenile hormone esterase-like [Cotesia glomerata]